jgi:hypothetical protein
MNDQDFKVTLGALSLGVGALAAHHVSEGTMEPTIVAFAKGETARGILFGAGGGAAVGIVTKASVVEILGRTFVGGLMAAVVAPWMAENVLNVSTSAKVYPVLCCSIGVLGFQIVKMIMDNPASIPGVGKYMQTLGANSASAPQGSPHSASFPSQAPLPMPEQTPSEHRPASNVQGGYSGHGSAPRSIRVPHAR